MTTSSQSEVENFMLSLGNDALSYFLVMESDIKLSDNDESVCSYKYKGEKLLVSITDVEVAGTVNGYRFIVNFEE